MREELKSYLLNLQGLEFISEKQLFPELEYIFKHALTQEVAYNSLLVTRRKEIHDKIGRAIEELYPDHLEEYYELLAYHYTRSANTEKAVEYLDLANQKAAKLNAVQEAKTYFDEAMKLLDTLAETEDTQQRRISLLVNQWAMFFLLFRSSEYYDLLTRYEPMAVRLGNQGLLGALNARLAQCEWWPGRFDQAIERGSKAIELCEVAGNAEGAGMAYLAMQWSYLFKGDYDRVLALKQDILRIMEQRFDLRTYVWAFSAASLAYTELGRWDEAVQEGREGLGVAERFSDNSMISFAYLTISTAYINKGDLGQGIEYGELAEHKAPTPADKVWAQASLALAWIRAGEPHRGIETLAPLVPMYRAVSYSGGEGQIMLSLGEGYWLTGEYDKARHTLEECLELAERCGMKAYIGIAHRLLAEIALKTDPVQAESHFERAIAILREIKDENQLPRAYAGYGRFHKQGGNMAQTRQYLTKALEIFERLGTLIEPDKVREELASLPEG